LHSVNGVVMLKKLSDIFQPIPQGGYGAYDEENRKIQGITDELKRLCRIHEEEFGDSQTNGGSHVRCGELK